MEMLLPPELCHVFLIHSNATNSQIDLEGSDTFYEY